MRPRDKHVDALRCPEGTLYLHDHDRCPSCGGALTRVRIPSTATLVSHTTVRVNPSGEAFGLGVAVTGGGAATLCIVEGNVRGHGRDRVRLVLRDGRFHALAAGARVSRSRAQPSTRAGSRKS
jgi:uncharacterized OB-fold protein